MRGERIYMVEWERDLHREEDGERGLNGGEDYCEKGVGRVQNERAFEVRVEWVEKT